MTDDKSGREPAPTTTPTSAVAPPVSPDGRFWWDGSEWRPMPGRDVIGPHTVGVGGEIKSGSRRPRSWILLCGALIVAAWSFYAYRDYVAFTGASEGSSFTSKPAPVGEQVFDGAWDVDCDYLIETALDISADQEAFVTLLDVRTPEIVIDNRDTYEAPVGADEAKLLVCEGVGVWSRGKNSPVRLIGSVDAKHQIWVEYRGK